MKSMTIQISLVRVHVQTNIIVTDVVYNIYNCHNKLNLAVVVLSYPIRLHKEQ